MIDLITRASRYFRLGEHAEGSHLITQLIDSLQTELSAQGALAETQQSLLVVLQLLLEAQGRGDFLYVADLLEYELAPFVSN